MNDMLLDILWTKNKGTGCTFSLKKINVFDTNSQSLTQISLKQNPEEILTMIENFQFHSIMTGAAIVFEQIVEEFGKTKQAQYICVNGTIIETQKVVDLLREWDMEPYRTFETMDSDLNNFLLHYSNDFGLTYQKAGDDIFIWKRIPNIDKLTLEEKFINIMTHDRYDNDNTYQTNTTKKYRIS